MSAPRQDRRICVVTGTRAEFGLLRGVMEGVRDTPGLQLQVLATGAHLSPEHGLTWREIAQAGFAIDAKVEMLLGADTATAVSKSMGLAMIGFADALERLAPDVVLLLGDRYEILCAAAAATVARIPVAHLHGGETTEGAIDEAIRHAVTKMSHLHFVAAEPYRQRVVQLGEAPGRVFLVGGLGVDAIRRIAPMDRAALEASMGFTFRARNLLVTFHPVTLDGADSTAQMDELLAALARLPDTGLVFTMPNADTGNRALAERVDAFVAAHPNACVFTSLGQLRYLSCMRLVDGVVGNSSSGIAEAPSLGVGTVDIGDRQRGRLKATSVVECPPQRDAILAAIGRLYEPAFRAALPATVNPYGDGGASAKIVQVLRDQPLDGILKKTFHDLAQPVPAPAADGAAGAGAYA